MSDLTGKVALVSGGASGIGAAHAEVFVECGASVVIGDIIESEGRALADKLGDRAHFVILDVTSEADWSRAVEVAVKKFGRLDVLVNNAGIYPASPLLDTTKELFSNVLNVNLLGTFLGLKAAVPAMSAGASVINIGSVDGRRGVPGLGAYASSKAGVYNLTQTAAVELAPRGIRVVGIEPGATASANVIKGGNDYLIANGVPPEQADIEAVLAQTIPFGRMADPREIAELSAFVAGPGGAYMTGSSIVIDGGLIAGPSAH